MCATQWRISPMGERTGLDYSAVFSVANMIELPTGRDLLEQIRLLEVGALAAMRGGELEKLLNG